MKQLAPGRTRVRRERPPTLEKAMADTRDRDNINVAQFHIIFTRVEMKWFFEEEVLRDSHVFQQPGFFGEVRMPGCPDLYLSHHSRLRARHVRTLKRGESYGGVH